MTPRPSMIVEAALAAGIEITHVPAGKKTKTKKAPSKPRASAVTQSQIATRNAEAGIPLAETYAQRAKKSLAKSRRLQALRMKSLKD